MEQRGKQLCTFLVDGFLFGIEVGQIQEVIRYQEITRVPLASTVVRGLINLRGQIVPAIDTRCLLNRGKFSDISSAMNVIVRCGGDLLSFLVDEIGDVLETDNMDFEPPPETLQGVARELIHGTYKLPDRLLLALDTEKMVRQTIDFNAGN